jgi:hypothetical protein
MAQGRMAQAQAPWLEYGSLRLVEEQVDGQSTSTQNWSRSEAVALTTDNTHATHIYISATNLNQDQHSLALHPAASSLAGSSHGNFTDGQLASS